MNNKRRTQNQDTRWYPLVLSSLAVSSGIAIFWFFSAEPIQIDKQKNRKALSHPLKQQLSFAIQEAFTQNLNPNICHRVSEELDGFRLDENHILRSASNHDLSQKLPEKADEIVQACIIDMKKPGSGAIAGCFWVKPESSISGKLKRGDIINEFNRYHLVELKLQFRDYKQRVPVSCESIFLTPTNALGVVAYYSVYWTDNPEKPLTQKVTGGFQIDLPRFVIEKAVNQNRFKSF